MPAIFSSKRTLRRWRVMASLQPMPSSAEAAGACIRVERLLEGLVASFGRRFDDLPAAQDEPGPLDRARREVEHDLALDGVLDGAVVDLAAGDVHVAGVHRTAAAGEAQAQVGAVADDAHLLGAIEPLEHGAHALGLGIPVAEAGVVEDVLVLGEREAGLAGEPRRGEVAAHSAPLATPRAVGRQVRAQRLLRERRDLRRAAGRRGDDENRAVDAVDDLLLERRQP